MILLQSMHVLKMWSSVYVFNTGSTNSFWMNTKILTIDLEFFFKNSFKKLSPKKSPKRSLQDYYFGPQDLYVDALLWPFYTQFTFKKSRQLLKGPQLAITACFNKSSTFKYRQTSVKSSLGNLPPLQFYGKITSHLLSTSN